MGLKDLPLQSPFLDRGIPHVSSWIWGWPYPWAAKEPAPPNWPCSLPCPSRNLLLRHHLSKECHPAPRMGPRPVVLLVGRPSSPPRWMTLSVCLRVVWPPFGAHPPRRDGFFLFLPPPYLSNPSSSCGWRDLLGRVERVKRCEACSGWPSPQVGTPAAPGELISACIESSSLQALWCLLKGCVLELKEDG